MKVVFEEQERLETFLASGEAWQRKAVGWITTHEQTCTDPEDAAPLLQVSYDYNRSIHRGRRR
jgi:hypothetical protein